MIARACVALALVLVLAVPALAQQPPVAPPDPPNILLIVRVGTREGGKRTVAKTYNLLLASGPKGSRLLSGTRVPLPSSTQEGTTQYVYQNIGFSITANAQVLPGGKVFVDALLEDSRLKGAPNAGGVPPTVETRQVAVTAVLADGAPAEVTQVEGVIDLPGFLEIEARILR